MRHTGLSSAARMRFMFPWGVMGVSGMEDWVAGVVNFVFGRVQARFKVPKRFW